MIPTRIMVCTNNQIEMCIRLIYTVMAAKRNRRACKHRMITSITQNAKEYLNRKVSVVIASLLGAWIISFPYEGQMLYTLAKSYGVESAGTLDISLIMLVVGLVAGGIFIRSIQTAKRVLLVSIPLCILLTVTFLFETYAIWMITLAACAATAGMCITACGHFIQQEIEPDNRFRAAAEMLICISIFRMVISNISLYISMQAGITFILLILGGAWYLALRMLTGANKKSYPRVFDKKVAQKALWVLFLFITIVAIDYGIMTQIISPKYHSYDWLTSWYWLVPYGGAAYLMRQTKKADNRNNLLYVAIGLIGFGFVLFLMMDYSISSYLIVNTVMMGAWAIFDVFWWSKLAEMFEMAKNPAVLFSVGFSALMFGVLTGKVIAENNLVIPHFSLYVVPMAVICSTMVLLPVLHRFLSSMIKKNTELQVVPHNTEGLTERERQIVALLLKGRTYKLISSELHLSENTVKTHIKNIYSKLAVNSKAELFKYIME